MHKQYLLLLPTGGFNDVLNQLARAWTYAEFHKRTLVVDTRYGHFRDPLSRYFSTKEKNVVLHPGTALFRHFDSLSTWPPDVRGRPLEALKIQSDAQKNVYSSTMDIFRPYQEDLLVHRSRGGGSMGHAALRKLRLVPEVAQEIAGALAALGEDYDAVHIRNTDVRTDYLSAFREMFPQVQGRKLLVCSDDLLCREEAKQFFVESEVVSITNIPDTGGKALHAYVGQDAFTKNLAMLTDLFALSRARQLFITQFAHHPNPRVTAGISGFSQLAVALRNHLEIVDSLFTALPPGVPFAKSSVPSPDSV